MLYYLFHYLDQLDFPGAGMFKYISFRSGMALIFSLFISTIIGKKIIDKLQYMQIGEIVRDLGLEGQMSKKGTPTMGGIIIIIAIIIPCLLFGRLENIYMLLMLITTVWLGAIGFLDDYIKVFKKDKEGLHGRFKIIGQVGLGLIVGLTLYLSPDVVIRENVYAKNTNNEEVIKYMPENIKSTQTTIPFLKNNNFDYADLVPFLGENAQIAGWIIFILVTIFIVTAVSNGANLTDGLDGLATGSSAIIGVTLGILVLDAGVELYRYDNGFLHAKLVIVDDTLASVGTANMDYRSLTDNLEVTAFIRDRETVRLLAATFDDDLASCRRITRAEWRPPLWRRTLGDVLRLVSPLM